MGKKVVKRRKRGVKEFKRDIALIDKKEREIEKRFAKIPGGIRAIKKKQLAGKKIKKEKKKSRPFYALYILIFLVVGSLVYALGNKVVAILHLQKNLLLYIVSGLVILGIFIFVAEKIKIKKARKALKPFVKGILVKAEKEKKPKQGFFKKLRFRIRGRPKKIKIKPAVKKISLRAEKKIREKETKIKKRLFKKLRLRLRSKPKKEKKPKKLAKQKIRILKIKKKKKLKPAISKSERLKKSSRFLTYSLIAVIIFFIIYKGLGYFSSFFTDQLLFYAMVVIIFVTLAIAITYLIVHKKTKKIGILKEIKEKIAPKKEEAVQEGLSAKAVEAAVAEEIEEIKRPKFRTYKTDIDVLYDLVKNKGRVKISALAKTFNVDKKTIEDWAEMLEEHGLLKIHYPAIGEAELMIPKKEKRNEKNI